MNNQVSSNKMRTDTQLLEEYDRNGYVVLDNVINEEFLNNLQQKFFGKSNNEEDVSNRYGVGGNIDWKKIKNLAEKDELFFTLATLPAITQVVKTLMKDEPLVFRDVMVVKPKRHGAALAYHQDAEFWDVEPRDLVSVWIPFQDTTIENGCLKVIAGSHKIRYPHDLYISKNTRLPQFITQFLRRMSSLSGTGDSEGSGFAFFRSLKNFILGGLTRIFPFLGNLQELVARVPEAELRQEIDVPVRRGSAIFFHGLLLHASNPNPSDNDRLAFIPSYMGKHFTFTGIGVLQCLNAENPQEREYVEVAKS